MSNLTIAPGIFGTPMLFTMPQAVQDALAAGAIFPLRLGTPADDAKLVKKSSRSTSEVFWHSRRTGQYRRR